MVILNLTYETNGTDSKCNCSDIAGLFIVSVEWTYCWKAYVYGFAFLYGSLVLYSISTGIKFRKRLWSKRVVLALFSFIASLGTLNVLFLLIDPHMYYNRVPNFLVKILRKLSYPLIIGGYCLLQTIILKTTRLDIRPIRLNGRKFVTFVTLIYITFILSMEITGRLLKNDSKVSLITEGTFVLLSSYLCVSFIYGAPKLAKYANEVMKANKDLSVQNLSRKLEATSDHPSLYTPSRLRNPRIRRNTSSGNRISLISCSDTSDSDTRIEKYSSYKRRSSGGKRNKSLLSYQQKDIKTQSTVNDCPHLLKYTKRQKYSSSDEEMKSKRASNSTNLTIVDDDTRSDIENDCELFLNEISAPCVNNNIKSKRSLSFSDTTGMDGDIGGELVLSPFSLPTNDCNVFESGYVADSEQISNYSEEQFSNRRPLHEFQENGRKHSTSSFDMGLPSSSSFLSLYRLRQGWMLRNVIRLVYFVTFLITVEIFFKIYIIFSAYGGLFFTTKPDPWPWLIFHMSQSTNELAMLYIMMGVAHTVIARKFHRKGTRKRGKRRV